MLTHFLCSAPHLLLHLSCFSPPTTSFLLSSSCSFSLFLISLNLSTSFCFELFLSRFTTFDFSVPLLLSRSTCLDFSLLLLSRLFSFPSIIFLSSAFFHAPTHLSVFNAFLSSRMPSSLAECFADHCVSGVRFSPTRSCIVYGRPAHDRGNSGSKFA